MKEICPQCHRKKELHLFRKKKVRICKECFKKDPANFKICGWCKELRYPVTCDNKGKPLCNACNSVARLPMDKLEIKEAKLTRLLKIARLAHLKTKGAELTRRLKIVKLAIAEKT